jgi:hypothetical protein
MINSYILVGTHERKRPIKEPCLRREDDIKMNLKEKE